MDYTDATIQTAQPLQSRMIDFGGQKKTCHDDAELKRVAQDFEAIFIGQILKQLDEGMDHEDNILYAGQAEDVFRNMFNQELAQSMSEAGGFGLADMIEDTLKEHEQKNAAIQEG